MALRSLTTLACRGQKSLVQGCSVLLLSDSGGNGHFRRRRTADFNPLLLGAVALAVPCVALAEEAASKGDDKLPKKPITKKLLTHEEAKTRLDEMILTERRTNVALPRRPGMVPQVVGDEADGVLKIELPVPANCNFAKVIASFIGKLQKDGKVFEVHTMKDKIDSTDLSFITHGGKGSVLLTCPKPPAECKLILFKDDGFTEMELDALLESYIAAYTTGNTPTIRDPWTPPQENKIIQDRKASAEKDALNKLRKLGAEVYEASAEEAKGKQALDWDSLAGYEPIKREVEDTVVMALMHPEKYEEIARTTRERYESNMPRAVLFEGPPGTGKTLTARIIATRSRVPMVYVPVERIMTKWFGESENKLSKIFDACNELGGAIIFIDEVDALATSRDSGQMHEATRRILSVILQNIEGFKLGNKSVLVCATNRKQDLDAALLSRFDTCIKFDLPSTSARTKIFARYAKHLRPQDLETLAIKSDGMSCRDIKETCENAERRWASKLIRGIEAEKIPPFSEYMIALQNRLHSAHGGRPNNPPHHVI